MEVRDSLLYSAIPLARYSLLKWIFFYFWYYIRYYRGTTERKVPAMPAA